MDALALRADEGRDKLRKAAVRSKYPVDEGVKTDVMVAQGGLFKTPVIAQQVLSDSLGIPITVMETASEGGPWGMAVLAVYAQDDNDQEPLADFLDTKVFKDPQSTTLTPNAEGVEGCKEFIASYQAGLPIEQQAGGLVVDK